MTVATLPDSPSAAVIAESRPAPHPALPRDRAATAMRWRRCAGNCGAGSSPRMAPTTTRRAGCSISRSTAARWRSCASADAHDVATVVNFARDHGLPLAVRSGGHSLAYLSVIDDAIVVDLSDMARVSIDPEARIARVQPGATSGDLAGPANAHGLALSTGDTHSVGMGGLTTGGGIGFMVRKYGLAIDNLLAAQVVTAAGDIVTASAEEHPDLFWAIRGGGGNVGIVTEFTFRLAPVKADSGRRIAAARQSRGPARLPRLRGRGARRPDDDCEPDVSRRRRPMSPPERVGELVLSILVCWTGDIAAGEQALAPLRALATPVADTVAPIPYPEIYRFTAHQAEPHAASIRMMFADELSDEALDAALAAMQRASSPFSLVQFRGLGGAMARVADDATAFAHRQRRYFVAVIGLWLDPARGCRAARGLDGERSGGRSATRGAASTSTSCRTRAPTACARPIPRPPTPGWRRSSGATTRRISSASTRTSRRNREGDVMDDKCFDEMVRAASDCGSRRNALRAIAGGLLVALAPALGAGKGKRGKKKGKRREPCAERCGGRCVARCPDVMTRNESSCQCECPDRMISCGRSASVKTAAVRAKRSAAAAASEHKTAVPTPNGSAPTDLAWTRAPVARCSRPPARPIPVAAA